MHRTALVSILLCSAALPAVAQQGPEAVQPGQEGFEEAVLVEGLEGPWELTWGPDDMLWVTERTAGRVTRINPEDGSTQVAATIEEVEAPGGQDGLLGMALHPELGQGTGNDFVYVAYTYLDEERGPDPTVQDPESPYRFLYAKIVRFAWDPEAQTLGEPQEVIAGLPASNDHNSGRLKIGPDGVLYYTIGDQGNNQLANYCVPIEAQRLPTAEEVGAEDYVAYVGKSLRINLDGSIPEDNPEIDGVRSHVFTYGHRNMQGIVFGPNGTLYASEQGPKTDDELNILQAGGNYGWPHIVGFQDDQAYVYARWSEPEVPCAEIEFSDIVIPDSVPYTRETDWPLPPNVQMPMATMFTVPNDYEFQDPACEGIDFICWPTVAASSIDIYAPEEEAIPGWGDSLIFTTLKRGSLYRVELNEDGTDVEGPFFRYFQSENRFRDTAISPDGQTIYVATDPGGLAESLQGGTTTEMANPGAILAFRFTGETAAAPAEETETPEAQAEAGQQQTSIGDDQPASQGEVGPAGELAPGEEPQDETASGEAPADPPTEADNVDADTTAMYFAPLFTAAQVEQGRASYNSACATCHGSNLRNGTMGPPLAGTRFEQRWFGQSVADLYVYTHDHMPPSDPGSLPDETYANVTAYILSVNGFEPGDQELTPDPAALANQGLVQPEE